MGHLRSTVIGRALVNIYETTGYIVIKDNHLGDWGTPIRQAGLRLSAMGRQEKNSRNPIKELNELYIKFHEEAEKIRVKTKPGDFFKNGKRGQKAIEIMD